MTAPEARGGAGGVGGTEAEAGAVKTVAASMLQQWVALRLIMLLEPGGLLSLSLGGQCWAVVKWRVWIGQ